MAHNTHIPWTLLSSQFKFMPTSRKSRGQTNLFPRHLPSQGSELMHFSRVFAQTLASFSASERSKYPTPILPLEPDEIIISEATLKKTAKTVKHYRTHCLPTCRHSWPYTPGCNCPLQPPERQMRFWIEELDSCTYCCCHKHGHSDTMELAKTLLLYGEIETLLRIQACPEVRFESKWNLPWECAKVYGWDEMMRSCLMSYIFLNVVYLHPEIWDVESKAKWIKGRRKAGTAIEEEEVDYRRMTSWSKVLSRCTGYLRYDVHTYPHRQFYGTNQDAYDGTRWNREGAGRWHRKPVIPGKPEVGEGDRYLPLFDDVDIVLFILRLKGLPTELGLQILTYADFKPERRLPVADDPFNPANKEELRKYLSWCWKVLVWTDVLMTASGRRIGWVYEVTDVIHTLWGDDKQIIRVVGEEKQARKMWRWGTHDEDDAEQGTGELSIPGPRVIFH